MYDIDYKEYGIDFDKFKSRIKKVINLIPKFEDVTIEYPIDLKKKMKTNDYFDEKIRLDLDNHLDSNVNDPKKLIFDILKCGVIVETKIESRKSFGLSLSILKIITRTLNPNPFNDLEKLDISDLGIQGLLHISEITDGDSIQENIMYENCKEGNFLNAMIQMVDSDSRNLSFTLRKSNLPKKLEEYPLGLIEYEIELNPNKKCYETLSMREQIESQGEKFLKEIENSMQFRNPMSLLCMINHYEIVENFSILKPKRSNKKGEQNYFYDHLRHEQNKIIANSLLKRAHNYIKRKEDSKAMSIFDEIKEVDPRNFEAYLGAAIIYFNKEDFVNAKKEFLKTKKLDDKNKQANYYLQKLSHIVVDNPSSDDLRNQHVDRSPLRDRSLGKRREKSKERNSERNRDGDRSNKKDNNNTSNNKKDNYRRDSYERREERGGDKRDNKNSRNDSLDNSKERNKNDGRKRDRSKERNRDRSTERNRGDDKKENRKDSIRGGNSGRKESPERRKRDRSYENRSTERNRRDSDVKRKESDKSHQRGGGNREDKNQIEERNPRKEGDDNRNNRKEEDRYRKGDGRKDRRMSREREDNNYRRNSSPYDDDYDRYEDNKSFNDYPRNQRYNHRDSYNSEKNYRDDDDLNYSSTSNKDNRYRKRSLSRDSREMRNNRNYSNRSPSQDRKRRNDSPDRGYNRNYNEKYDDDYYDSYDNDRNYSRRDSRERYSKRERVDTLTYTRDSDNKRRDRERN